MSNKPKLLIVEDDRSITHTIAECLKEEHLEARSVSSAAEAISALDEEDFDVILSEVCLPGTSGLELMERARDLGSEHVMILISGVATIDMVLDAVKRGLAHYLPKPFAPKQIVAAVFCALAHQRLLSENQELRKRIQGLAKAAELMNEGMGCPT